LGSAATLPFYRAMRMLVGPSTEEGPIARRARNAVLRLGSERLLMGAPPPDLPRFPANKISR